jgi:hypothetical protein
LLTDALKTSTTGCGAEKPHEHKMMMMVLAQAARILRAASSPLHSRQQIIKGHSIQTVRLKEF